MSLVKLGFFLAFSCVLLGAGAQEALLLNRESLGWAPPSQFSYYLVSPPKGFPSQLVATLNVSASTEQSSGNVWVFIRQGALPTTTQYDYAIQTSDAVKIWSGSFNLTSSVFVGVYGQGQAGTNWFDISLTGIGVLQEGEVVGGAWLEAKTFDLYTFNVDANTAQLQIAYQAGYGDFDMYLGVGFVPTTSKYSYANTTGQNMACIQVAKPPAGKYYYMVYALYAGHYKTQFTTTTSKKAGDGIQGCQSMSAAEFLVSQEKMFNKLIQKHRR